MSIFDVEIGYWIGMAAVSGLTLAYILVCWLIPPKKLKNKSQIVHHEAGDN